MGLWVDAAISHLQLTLFFRETMAYPSDLSFKTMTGLQTGWSGTTPILVFFSILLKRWIFSVGFIAGIQKMIAKFSTISLGEDRSDCYYPKRPRNSILKIAFSCVHLPIVPADPCLSHFLPYNGHSFLMSLFSYRRHWLLCSASQSDAVQVRN